MASQNHKQRPYSTLHLPEEDTTPQYYQHPAQASQYSLHTPVDPNPPNSSFRSQPSPISPRIPSGELPSRSPGFLQMEHQHQSLTSSAAHPRRITRVFDGDESPVESPVETGFSLPPQGQEQQVQQSQLEHSQPIQSIEYAHQPQSQQYRKSPPTGYNQQPQGQEPQYEQPPTGYYNQQAYNAHVQSQHAASLPSAGFPQSQFDHHSQTNTQFSRHTSQQYGPSPQYVSHPHSPSFPPPPQSPSFSPLPHSPSFPPPPRSATFIPQSLSFPPPLHSPSFSPPPHSLSFSPPPHSPGYLPHTPGYASHPPTFPPPPTSEISQPSVPTMPSTIPISTATPPPGGQGVELVTRPPAPPAPIGTPGHRPGFEGPKTPIYTPGGGSGPNGGTHAPGQISHPNQQHGKEEYSHGLCDCFGEFSTCCVGYWCPCILYSRTHHRLNTSPNSNLNDFHNCNGHCVCFCALAPVSWIFTLLQRGRIRDKYKLEGTVMSDCGKAYCCVMCTLVQDEREVTEREDERRRNAGPGSGVVGEGAYRRHGGMIYG